MPMVTKSFILFCVVIIVNSITISVSQEIWSPRCDENANFTRNGTYQRNLDDALSSLTSDTSIRYGFYNRSVGEIPNQVNAIGLCRGDMEPDDCRKCINESIPKLRQVCPNQKGAIGWLDDCMLRYSNVSFLGILDTRYAGGVVNGINTSNVDQFNQALDQLLDRLRAEASNGGSLRKYASNDTNGPGFVTIYGLMQCTPDLSELDCYNCLDNAIRFIPNCCYGNSSNTTVIVVIAVIASVSLVILVVVFVIVFRRRKRKLQRRQPENSVDEDEDVDEISAAESLQYSFGVIREATDDFSENNKLGQGGFGLVYKAWKSWRDGTASSLIDPTLYSSSLLNAQTSIPSSTPFRGNHIFKIPIIKVILSVT
ncbi:cysteine-rich receptor-like protein kinase 8 [Artemisia annua]|uniref:Cysteine-rich receptor-like protein kinase 8 n=1 Tax=Artemisia annua TaxID=35608 RepID=A0A2U1NHP8_ARTAN|nr:cysteine-rich receptor-like protein kinase 8 [Artemisia annua]